MIREGLQYRPVIVIMLAIFLLIGLFSMGMRFATAAPSYHYNIGYNNGLKNAECDFKHCHGHGYDRTVPSGHTTAYDKGYTKGYHDGWNKNTGDGKTQQSTLNGMGRINETISKNSTILKSQEIPNNHGCDPTHQFCTMTPR